MITVSGRGGSRMFKPPDTRKNSSSISAWNVASAVWSLIVKTDMTKTKNIDYTIDAIFCICLGTRLSLMGLAFG